MRNIQRKPDDCGRRACKHSIWSSSARFVGRSRRSDPSNLRENPQRSPVSSVIMGDILPNSHCPTIITSRFSPFYTPCSTQQTTRNAQNRHEHICFKPRCYQLPTIADESSCILLSTTWPVHSSSLQIP